MVAQDNGVMLMNLAVTLTFLSDVYFNEHSVMEKKKKDKSGPDDMPQAFLWLSWLFFSIGKPLFMMRKLAKVVPVHKNDPKST